MLKSKKKYTQNTNRNSIALIALLTFVSLSLLIIIKYNNQNLSITEVDLFYLGNLMNIFTYLSFLVGLALLYYKDIKIYNSVKRVVLFFLWLSLILLIFASVFGQSQIPLPDVYILKQSIKRVLTAVFYVLSQFSLIVITVYIWLELIKHKTAVIIRTTINSIIVILMLFGFSFIYVQKNYSEDVKNLKDNNQIGVVLGAAVWSNNKPSSSLKIRVDKAIQLYNSKKIRKIQLTGGNAPGELSEAEVAFNYLKQFNVNLNDVFIENKTASTADQLSFIKNELSNSLSSKNIVVISNNYHLSRIHQMSKFYDIEINLVPAEMSMSWQNSLYYKVREAIALLLFWFFAI